MKTYFRIALVVVVSVGLGRSFGVSIRTEKKDRKNMAVTTASGLTYVDLKEGTGQAAANGDQVAVHYTGWLTNGKKFDSSVDRKMPFTFLLGGGTVIKGWDEGIQGMKIGGKRKLTIPATLAYGERGAGALIPPNSILVFEVELLTVGKK
jgi:FKBP-type peptidyl-prolyl cis-trans isomerase